MSHAPHTRELMIRQRYHVADSVDHEFSTYRSAQDMLGNFAQLHNVGGNLKIISTGPLLFARDVMGRP
jgi:hypothetical protein